MNFETLIRYKTLDRVYGLGNHKLVDHFRGNPEVEEQLGTKKIQFDAHKFQADDLEEVTSILDMSKREFLEAAVSEALRKAHEIIENEKLFERMKEVDQMEEEVQKC